ncbi:MAG: glycine cleavage T C-terminal barrel domain-containing protein [Acidobacteriaceae bacterium]
MQPASHSKEAAELAALLSGAGVAPLDDVGWIRVTGSDRVRWLNGMVTNSIQALAAGEGCYCFVLNVQGRIQGDLTAFLEDDAILLRTDRTRLPGLMALLDRFVIMDDVELADVSDGRTGVAIAGPAAAAVLEAIELPVGSLNPVQRRRVEWRGVRLWLVQDYAPMIPRFEVWADAPGSSSVVEALTEAGAVRVSTVAFEQLRVLEGTPRYGTDIRERDLPQETGQTRALHFSKGCYLGQEIVERIRSRGQVHRMFVGFELSGELPSVGSPLEADGKAVGELTSVAAVEHPVAGRIQLALGYVRREAVERGLPLAFAGGTAAPIALPYTRA